MIERICMLCLVPVIGCSVPNDEIDGALDTFETPRLELRKKASGGFSLDVTLVPRAGIGSPCPVLPDAKAKLGTSQLVVTSTGGYDDLTAKCNDVAWNLDLVPRVAAAKVEITSGSDTRTCSLRDAHLPRELALRDGGTWMRPSAGGTIEVVFADTMIAPPSITASLTPVVTQAPTVSLVSTTSEGVHTLELPMLAAQDYVLHIETPPVTLTTACTVIAEPFADQPLTIVE